jgi:NitT/TauT family transport system ATP-binding protein
VIALESPPNHERTDHERTVSAPAAGLAVVLSGVRKVFGGDVVAVDGIDLEVPEGQFLALLGPSGCGKSTLLRIIAGLEAPSAGSVALEPSGNGGNSPARDSPAARARIAYVFQDAHLLPWRNVLRNVALPLELAGVPRAQRCTAAVDAIAQVGLADAQDRYPAQLSGGMRMRVSLARALVTNPSLLLLDEPFAALDEITRQQLDDQLHQLWWQRRMTVLFVTHSILEATYLAQRAVVLSRRPARIVLDDLLELPAQRTPELRTEQTFARTMRRLFTALEADDRGTVEAVDRGATAT